MSLIQWDNSLSVKVIQIDRQHKQLVAMINDLNEAMHQGKGKDVLGQIIKELIRYAAIHFSTEEKYFDLYRYPETANHKKEHSDFIKKVNTFKDGFEAGTLGLSIQVIHFLSDWLQKHIKGTDKQYGPFFNEKGLK